MSGARLPLLAALALLLLPALPASAHEVRPAYLEMTALEGGAWDVLWKVPAKGELRLGLYVRLPEGCESTAPQGHAVGSAHVERWRAHCPAGLAGETIAIDGLAATRTDVLARLSHGDGTTQTVRLTPDAPAFVARPAAGALAVAGTYLGLGVEHILLGADHLLFVAALLFLVGDARRLVGAVTAFTAAHSVTLGAAALGWLRVPTPPVEACIALSIVIVAAEVVQPRDSAARRRPWLVAFAFGLLHGLGFASALAEIGLPPHAIPLALACFNLGVEAGQLLFIAALFAALALASRAAGPAAGVWALADRLARPAAYGIGTLGTFWLIDRTVSFFAPALY